MRRRIGASLVAVVLVALAPAARAGDAQDRATADKLFRSGRAAAKRGDFAAACADFAESQRLDPALGTLLNLSECEEKLGRLLSASRHIQQAIGRLPARDDRLAPARARLESLTKRIPHLAVRLGADAPKDGTTVLRDGAPIDAAVLGTPEQIDPGEHTIVVRAPEHDDSSTKVTMIEGEDRTIDVKPGARRLASTPPVVTVERPPPRERVPAEKQAETDDGSSQRRLGLILGGIGVVGLGVGATFGIVALGHQSDRDAACGGEYPNCRAVGARQGEVRSAQDALKTTGTISTIGFGVGLAGLVAGGVLYFTAGRKPATATHVVPLVAHDGTGVAVMRRW